jgi:hypothetical protein
VEAANLGRVEISRFSA